MPRPPFLAPMLIIAGAVLLILTAGAEIALALRMWLDGVGELPKELILHTLVAGAALLLAAAVLMTRRSMQERALAESALRQSEERMRLVANNVPALISYVDREQRYRFSNRTYDAWFGIAHEEMIGRTVAEVFGDDAYARMRPDIERCIAGETVEFEFTTTDGARRRTMHISCVPHLGPRTEHGSEVLGFYMLANDVTALKRAQEDLRFAAVQLQHDARRLEFLAHHDTLTGLPNRAMFADRAREAVAHARRHDKTAAFLFLDMDNFKQVNDSLGHEVGDGLLKVMASRLRASVRGDDFVARIGGDEFCVLLQDIAEPHEAAAVAQKLLAELSKPCQVGEHEVSSGASIGIACVPQDGDDAMTLLKHADAAMYRAKERGRNGYQFFSANMNREAAAAAALADELRDGLARGELFLEYQPRVDNATGLAVGAEALARWRHPRMGVLAPEAFLPLSDESGLAAPLGAWMLREACAQARRWHDAGAAQFAVAVNVSARQLRHGGLAEGVSAALDSSRLPGTALLIEVPESALRQVPGTLEDALAALAATGARLAVDKFGTGYASVPLLKRLRVDAVCIDPKLTAGVPGDRERSALTRALIALARGLNLEVVAKGVESAAQREFLVDAGCRVGQGSLYAAPRPAQDIEPLLAAQRAA